MNIRDLSLHAQAAISAILDPVDGGMDMESAREVRDYIDSELERYQKIGEAYMKEFHRKQRMTQ